ncbi:hypothetical protein TYRP_010914 [Tyrophagus putrescentiae]|nr:hypothetical protein TYRP_010914 [Tyrophagus putrescentiae]
MTMTAVDKTMGSESTTGASVGTERIRVIGAQAPANDSHCFCCGRGNSIWRIWHRNGWQD